MRLKPEGVPCNRCTVWYCSAMQAVFFRRSIFTRAMLFCSSASVFSYEGGKYLIMSLEAGESQQMKKSKPFFRWTDHSKIHNLSKDLSYTVTPHSQSFWKLFLGKAFTNAWWWLREIKKKKAGYTGCNTSHDRVTKYNRFILSTKTGDMETLYFSNEQDGQTSSPTIRPSTQSIVKKVNVVAIKKGNTVKWKGTKPA